MTESTPMSREELLELAALDALGLLSEYEAALYTRSFHYATATVQNEILALQAMIASDESLLPNEEPSPDLRRRVLDHVASVIERESPAPTPLATIGRRRSELVDSPRIEPAERHRAATGFHATTVSRQFWRAATFVLCGTIVVVAWFAGNAIRNHHELVRWVYSDTVNKEIEQQLGPTFKEFLFDPRTSFVHLEATDPDADYRATIGMIEGVERAVLVVEGLPWDSGYELRIRDAEGNLERVVTTFDIGQQLAGVAIDLPAGMQPGAGAKWEIAFRGEVLLASA